MFTKLYMREKKNETPKTRGNTVQCWSVRVAWRGSMGYAGSFFYFDNVNDIKRTELESLECYIMLQDPPHTHSTQ